MPSAASYPVLGDFPCFSHKRYNHIVDENFVVSGSLLKKPVLTKIADEYPSEVNLYGLTLDETISILPSNP
jgi:hypothetical protein